MNLKFLESLTTRQKQGIAAVGGIILVAVVVVLVVVLSSGGDDDDMATASGTPGQTPNASAQPTEGPTPDETDIANGTPAAPSARPTSSGPTPNGGQAPPEPPLPTSLPDGPTMQLRVVSGGSCDGSECFVDAGSTFALGVDAVRVPSAGYVLVQTYIDFGAHDPIASEDGEGPGSCSDGVDNGGGQPGDGADRRDSDCATAVLTYLPADEASEEVVWEDAAPAVTVRDQLGPGLLIHGALTGLTPPLPISNFAGLVLRIQIACPDTPVSVPISLLTYGDPVAGTSGSAFVEPPGEIKVAPFTAPINLHCE